MLILKVTSGNVAEVKEMVIMVVTAISELTFVIFDWGNEKNRSFQLIPRTPFRWMNPKVIGSYTFKR